MIEPNSNVTRNEDQNKPFVIRSSECRFCGSKNVIGRGRRKNKNGWVQRFGCKDCGRRFTLYDKRLMKMEYKPEIVTLALDLYFKGLSYRDIVDHLRQF